MCYIYDMNKDKPRDLEKILKKLFDPPEALEVNVEILISRRSLTDSIDSMGLSEEHIKYQVYQEITRELMRIDAVKIQYSDQHMYDGIKVYGKLKVLEKGYKVKIL